MTQKSWIGRFILGAATLILGLTWGLSEQALAVERRLPVDLHLGFEQNEVILVDSAGVASKTQSEPSFSTTPVLKIISPLKLGCFGKRNIFNRGTTSQREGCFGAGIRLSGAQKRLSGTWFPPSATPDARPEYYLRTDQLAIEALLGHLSEVSLAFGLGLRTGINQYDLLVKDGSTILIDQRNRNQRFSSWTLYIDLQTLTTWPFGVEWPMDHVYFFYSYESTFDRANRFTVPDLNTTGEVEIEMKVNTRTITIEFLF